MPTTSRHWAILRLQAIAPLTIVEYRDHRTRLPRVFTSSTTGVPICPDPAWFDSALSEVLSHPNQRLGQAPIFLDAHQDLVFWDLEAFFAPALVSRWASRLTRAAWAERKTLTLPVRVASIGNDADSWFADLRAQSWAKDEAFERFALNIHVAERDAPSLILAVRPHVVITTDPVDVLAVAADMPLDDRPRFVVWADETLASSAPAKPPSDVSGTAVLRIGVGESQIAKQVTEIFYNFSHDKTLHEIAAALVAPPAFVPVRLTADPHTVQSFRLSGALDHIRREAQRWETILPTLSPGSPLATWIKNSRQISDFIGETHAFVPMARLGASRSEAQASAVSERSLAAKPATVDQPRAAHVSLDRLDTPNYLFPMKSTESLQADAAYQLRMHIGSNAVDSLIVQPVGLDPFLGPPSDETGYDLEVAIQGKSFVVESAGVVVLRLPLTGNSEPVYFEIRTPAVPGKYELRLCIYHRNYLVQSLLLEALVDLNETAHSEKVLTVRVETMQAPGYVGIAAVGGRSLSIGVNQGGSGTHDFMLKSDGVKHEVSLPATTFQNTYDDIRKLLDAASRDPQAPAIPFSYPKIPRGSPTPSNVADWIRAFTAWGHKLYDAFFDRVAQAGSPLRAKIVGLQTSSGKQIQVFRFKYEDAFLWPLLYDWDLPSNPTGPVCLGWSIAAGGMVMPCMHHSTSGEYCVNGFWGVRHRIEELLPGTPAKNVTPPKAEKPVRLVANPSLPESGVLTTNLNNDLGADVVMGPLLTAPLLDVLFNAAVSRPALLILLGHHERQALPGGLSQSRIQIDGSPEWLSEADVRSRVQKQVSAWAQPRSAVVMMACASATTGAETLTDFTTVWNACGASAIVGTECVIGPDLAAEFARAFAAKTWKQKMNLGDAMAEIRADLLATGNPLAFLFHAVGDIDLVLQ